MQSNQTEVSEIESKIYFIRGERIILDEDLADLYQISTKRLNEQVSRNLNRFPSDFMFVLTKHEVTHLRSQIATSSVDWGGRRYAPRAFTEQGVSMLSSVLSSPIAIQVNIAIMRAFVQMRMVLVSNTEFENRLKDLEAKYDNHDQQLRNVFDAIRKLMTDVSTPRKKISGLGNRQD